jgi:hypothetical protein
MADLAAARATELVRADTKQFYDWFFEQRAAAAVVPASEPDEAAATDPAEGTAPADDAAKPDAAKPDTAKPDEAKPDAPAPAVEPAAAAESKPATAPAAEE